MELKILNGSDPSKTARLMSLATFEGLALVRDGEIVAHNSQFSELLELDDESDVTIDSCFRSIDRDAVRELVGKDVSSYRDRVICEVSDDEWLELRTRTELPDLPERTVVLIVRDVTDEIRAENELRRAKADLEQFAYVASHDLKSPLRGISNLASWIRDDLGDDLDGQTAEYFQLLQGRIQRMETLLEDLLAYSRAGRKEASVASFWIDDLVEDVVDFVAPPEGFDVVVRCPHIQVTTTPTPLRTCIQNLVQNVFKHHDSETGSVLVCVSLDHETNELVVEVQDDGPGIAATFHEKIFAVFETLRPRDEVEGSGIGLALVRRLVEDAGGVVEIESPIENGRGACFRMAWPLLVPHREDDD